MNYETALKLNSIFWQCSEDEFLTHSFFLIGTTAEWVNGELVNHEDARPLKERILSFLEREIEYSRNNILCFTRALADMEENERVTKKRIEIEKDRQRVLVLNYFKKSFIDGVEDEQKLLKAIELISLYSELSDTIPHEAQTSLHPVMNGSPITILPDNIKQDWLEAAQKAICIARTKNCSKHEETILDEAEFNINRIRKAKKKV
jgi:hypothetical protein